MIKIVVSTLIQAPRDVCFDLARDMNAHAQTMASSGERIVSAPPSGLLELGDQVVFEASHFGVKQRLSAKIVEYERPNRFTDEMTKGAFKSLRHEHLFRSTADGTDMNDVVMLEAPLGPLGWLAERLFLGRYMRNLIRARGAALKKLAEESGSAVAQSTS